MTSINTPDEKKYKFYPTRGAIFTFKVSCANDCHVALSTLPQEGQPMYEIVIGGWQNTKSVIREIGKEPDLVEVYTPGIVNPNKLFGFWIRWHDNVIVVGRQSENVGFMTYRDPKLFPVNYVGICTAYGSTGAWLLEDNNTEDALSSTFERIDEVFAYTKHMQFVKTPNEKRYKFYPAQGEMFTFKVCCSNDCHVALSPQSHEALPMYEIVLGGWSNTKSVIRQNGKQPDVVEASTPFIVNANEGRAFWIRWHEKVISVGCEGEEVPFMSYEDAHLFDVKYIGICTAYGSTGYWLFRDATITRPVVRSVLSAGKQVKFVKTPDEKRYKFYHASDDVFEFKVCCSNDCHVALSKQPQEGQPMYEIVFGGWNNTKSVIREIGKQPDLVEVFTPNIVNANEARGFWVRWRQNVISVGCKGETQSFMYYRAPNLFKVRYVGICTAYKSDGVWLFDAPLKALKYMESDDRKSLTFVKTPDKKSYHFYPARDGVFAFKVCCTNDCHVALSTQPQEGLSTYEIVIGGWNNRKSAIRQIGKVPDLVYASTPDIVNSNEARGFWIRWHQNIISVGREEENISFMSYHDPNLFHVKYVGICTAYNSDGVWLFEDTTTKFADPTKTLSCSSEHLTLVKTPNEKRYKFYPVTMGQFTFNIICTNDCHVALSTLPLETLQMYEIVFGGWSNTKSVIRQMGKSPDVAEASSPGIVNSNEPRGFWIRWHDKVISVGCLGEDLPFMSYKDPNLFTVKYVGICTAFGSTGYWLFNDTSLNGLKSAGDVKDCIAFGNKNITFAKTAKNGVYKFYPVRGNTFRFKFAGANNCLITLSNQPRRELSMYDIIIGGWNNIKSAIRHTGQEPPEVDEASTPNIVNANEFYGFWVRWQDNIISVGREGETESFMSYKDPKVIPIKYVGIATCNESTGIWLIEDTVDTGTWVTAANGDVPTNAIKYDFNNGQTAIIARAQHEGSLIPGILIPSEEACTVTHKGSVLLKKNYEVLCLGIGHWVTVKDGVIPPNAVVGGYSDNGESLFIGRASYLGNLIAGKVQPSKGCCYIAYELKEIPCNEYDIYVAL